MTPEHFDQLRAELNLIHDKLERIDHAIRGNGSPGLNQRVAVLEESRKTNHTLWLTLSGLGLTVLGGLASALLAKII